MARSGLVASVWGNVSARVPRTSLALVTPSGVEYEELSEGMLGVVDVPSGTQVEGGLRPSSELAMHLAIYRAREDVLGIVHTHSIYASAHAVAHQNLPPVVEDAAQVVGGPVVCADYALPGTEGLARSAVRALGPRQAVLLANHGVVGVGPTAAEALRVCQLVEKAAQIHLLARLLGGAVPIATADVDALRQTYLTRYGQR
jgi:L-fuculose-phosphate aldolase